MSVTPFQIRAALTKRRLASTGLSQAEVARRLGYTSQAGYVYVKQVLGGKSTSYRMLDRIDAVLDAAEAEAESSTA